MSVAKAMLSDVYMYLSYFHCINDTVVYESSMKGMISQVCLVLPRTSRKILWGAAFSRFLWVEVRHLSELVFFFGG